ncbi:hypothetical protein AB0A74_37260 [Saccharothrix sp. NPDC042600]|uniref:hypothetical protein n=1 Tax=Saccharothrix TaxID=2071 RepID=UPI0033D8AA34|nr:hypothetical protein GCM10017745_16660 [Saccharothrix mutabilis subsp. capreolus]
MRPLARAAGAVSALAAALLVPVGTAQAHAPSGAIFTTLPDGSEVNFNHFPTKQDVHLDGGPGPGAPQEAAGLDDGTYVFQVTDPSGKVLLSTDPAACRQFTVSGGVITGVVDTSCEHVTGTDVDHNATTVQLFPYLDTPNNGGVYKVWVTTVEDFLLGCSQLGVANGLAVVDCGSTGGNRHGFIPAHSKTDNFKVGDKVIVEIDTRFNRWDTVGPLDGKKVTWTDTNGATNTKWSYYAPELYVFHEAHVEAVEVGVHKITVDHQPGCHVERVDVQNQHLTGPGTVSVRISNLNQEKTVFVDVLCS